MDSTDKLYEFQENLLKRVENSFFRSSFAKINWKQRMLGIRGLRGTGKTTMMLQHLKFNLKKNGLYVTADHPWFYDNTLLDLADRFAKDGGQVLLIDEIHKYPAWSRELKNIYDGFPELQVIFTASSALEIQKGEADLSRRVITYDLTGLSFREYLELEHGHHFPVSTLKDLLKNPNELSETVTSKIRPLQHFKKYLRTGYFPFAATEEPTEFLLKLNQVINTVLEVDLASVENYTLGNIIKLKKLMGVMAESAPFTPNISALAGKMKMSRDLLTEFIGHLQRARLLNLVNRSTKGVAALQKPDKIYLENTNLSFALKDKPDVGTIRETFLINQLRNAGHEVTLPLTGDFQTGDIIFEVGGKSKSDSSKAPKQFYLALDEIEHPSSNRIPLWLFGFLY